MQARKVRQPGSGFAPCHTRVRQRDSAPTTPGKTGLVAVVEGGLRGHDHADLAALELDPVEPLEGGVGGGGLLVLDDAVPLGLTRGVVLVDAHGEGPLVLVATLLLGDKHGKIMGGEVGQRLEGAFGAATGTVQGSGEEPQKHSPTKSMPDSVCVCARAFRLLLFGGYLWFTGGSHQRKTFCACETFSAETERGEGEEN